MDPQFNTYQHRETAEREFTKLKLLLNEVEKCKMQLAKQNVKLSLPDSIVNAKQAVYDILIKKHGRAVAYGPFANMLLNSQNWGDFDINAKILGTYECHVVAELQSLGRKNFGPFIDIGAADGFFAIGAIFSGIADEAFAFEIDASSRQSIAINASDNGVADRIHICEIANIKTVSDVLKQNSRALILIDIEGGEYELLDANFLDLISNCDIIVELHPNLVNGGTEKQANLIKRLSAHFEIEFFQKTEVRASGFPELAKLSDDKRLLALSENRAFDMHWLKLQPKHLS